MQLSILIRPIGVINLSVFFLFLFINKEIKLNFTFWFHSYFTFVHVIQLPNERFVYFCDNSFSKFIWRWVDKIKFINRESSFFLSKDGFRFISDNLSRLYGSGSRDCVFENCFIFNPLFNKEGLYHEIIFSNEILTYALRPILELVFKITSPTSLFIYLPFLLLLIFFSNKKNSFVFITIFTLNILFSVLTAEYGSRWWLYPNLLLIYLIPEF